MLTTPVWIGIYSNIINGFTYAFGSIGLLIILSRHDIGHRFMLRLLASFSMLRMIVCFTVAWDAYHNQISRTTSIFRLVSSMVGMVFIAYVLVRINHLIQTLRESESLDRLRANDRADAAQARLQITYLSAKTLERSERLATSHPAVPAIRRNAY